VHYKTLFWCITSLCRWKRS